ncbi:MAG TPA: hypothetical protein VK824_02330 [Planctomycetota bacterium]|nr:hypothetical protein [Planctomycetota bacterium]
MPDDVPPPPEPAGAFGGFIGPRTLVGLVRVAAPWLFESAPEPDEKEGLRAGARLCDLGDDELGWQRILLAHARRPELLVATAMPDAASRTDYFALCLAAHWASVATYVPTDVDAKIRHALWFEDQPPEELARMAQLALALSRWDIRGISARWVDAAALPGAAGSAHTISGHDGERLSVLCGGMLGLLAAGDAAGAERFEHEVDGELSREAAAFHACAAQPGRELELLRLAAILTHNAGDVMQGLGAKSGKRVGAAQKDRYGELARSGPALVGGVVAAGAGGTPHARAGEPSVARAGAPPDARIAGGRGKARYGGAFVQAAAIYRELLASEGHRHYPLRDARCLRSSAELLLPLGPCLDDWGARIATHPSLSLADRAEVVAALVHGCKRVPGQQGYDRALAGFDLAHKGGVEADAITDLLPAALRRELQSSERRRARAVRRGSFESSLAKAARRILAGR